MTTAAIPKAPIFSRIKRSTVVEFISGLYILLFIYTAISKLSNLDGFVSVISRSPLISMNMALYLAWLVPITEIIISIFLFVPKTRKIGLYAATSLMILFTGYVAYIISFAEKLPCSCGGVINRLSWSEHLIFNGAFVLLGIFGIWLLRKKH